MHTEEQVNHIWKLESVIKLSCKNLFCIDIMTRHGDDTLAPFSLLALKQIDDFKIFNSYLS